MEIDPSLILGVMGNQIIYPEHNPVTRNSFSCGQSKQAVSVYHSNYQMRIDKMGVLLNYGQTPLIKSRYLEYINNEEQPYGINAIVAIMSFTGYNVEDAILINEGSVHRGIFRTTYFSMYESREENSEISGNASSKFANIEKNNVIRTKAGFDYSQLDNYGMIKENTALNDKTVVIGKITSNPDDKDLWIDSSVTPKKGQLGFVDKSFITQGEEGSNIAKVRVREERVPAIGDKMASRAGQKGTLGLIIPEKDMPFASDGTRPDLIINPHAIPSRMTIGQIVESLFGKACAIYGGFGDCTAFQVKGSNYETYGPMLTKAGFHSSGKQLMYNGMSGEQIEADIYMGPTYYMRLKHMVKDKINYRARGPNTNLTRQPVQGRANDGGLRIGEMERDGVLAHGMSYFLNESFMIRGDEYHNVAVCNKTGAIAVYNNSKNLFFSLFSDGPINFHTNPDGSQNVKNVSKFGRSFSVLRVPYALKLLIQELEVLNIQMRLITDDNVDQLLNMSYSNNIAKLLKIEEPTDTIDYSKTITKEYYREVFNKWEKFQSKTGPALEADEFSLILKNKYEKIPNLALLNKSKEKQPIEKIIDNYIQDVKTSLTKQKKMIGVPDESPILPSPEQSQSLSGESPPYAPNQDSPPYAPNSPVNSQESPPYAPNSPPYVNSQESPPYAPNSPINSPDSPPYAPNSQEPLNIQSPPTPPQKSVPIDKESILEVETEPAESLKTEASNSNNNNNNDSKKIILSTDTNEAESK